MIKLIKKFFKMSGNKTRDGIRIGKVIKALDGITGVIIESANNHLYKAQYNGLRPCPIATSTDVRRMVVPWVMQATGYSDSRLVYQYLKNGEWESSA
jgi:hypothetical protein